MARGAAGGADAALATGGAVTGEVVAGGGDAAVDAEADAPFAREPEDTSTTVWLEEGCPDHPDHGSRHGHRCCDPLVLGEQPPATAGEPERERLVLSGRQTGRGVGERGPGSLRVHRQRAGAFRFG